MTYFVKWTVAGTDRTATSAVHSTTWSGFRYADTVHEVLSTMGKPMAMAEIWVEDDDGKRIDRPPKTTDS
jgi:hypothetical protein